MKKFLLLFAIAMAVVMAGTAAFAGIPAESESVGLVVRHSSNVFLVRNEAGKMVTDYYAGTNTPKVLEDFMKARMNHRHFNRALHPEEMKMINDKSIFNAHYAGMGLFTEHRREGGVSGDITLNFSADTALVTNSPVTRMRNSHKVFKQGTHDFKVRRNEYGYYSIVNEHDLQYELKEGAETSLSKQAFTFKMAWAGGKEIKEEFPEIQTTEAQMKTLKAVPYIELTTSGSGETEVVTGFNVRFVDPEDKDRTAVNVARLKLGEKIEYFYDIYVAKEYGEFDIVHSDSNGSLSGTWGDTVTIISEKPIPLSKFKEFKISFRAEKDIDDSTYLATSYRWSFENSEQELDFDELQDASIEDFTPGRIAEIQNDARVKKFIGESNIIKRNDFFEVEENNYVAFDMTTKFPAIRDGLGLNSARVSTAIWIPGAAVDNEGDALGVGFPQFPINPTNSAGERRIGTEIGNNEIDKIKQYYSVKKYFVTYDSSGNVESKGKFALNRSKEKNETSLSCCNNRC